MGWKWWAKARGSFGEHCWGVGVGYTFRAGFWALVNSWYLGKLCVCIPTFLFFWKWQTSLINSIGNHGLIRTCTLCCSVLLLELFLWEIHTYSPFARGLMWGSSLPLQLLVLQTQPGSWKSFYSSLAIKVQHIKLSPHLLLCHLIKRLLQENLWEVIYPADITEPRRNQGSLKIKNVTLSWVCSVLRFVLSLTFPPKLSFIFFSPEPFCHSFLLSPLVSPEQARTGSSPIWSDLKNAPAPFCFLDHLFFFFSEKKKSSIKLSREATALSWAVL